MKIVIPRHAVPATVGHVRFAPRKALWLWGHLLAGLIGLGIVPWSWALVCAGFALTVLTLCLGHSVFLHRALIHEALVIHPVLHRPLLLCFALTGLGGPLSWIRLHAVRDYWQCRSDCPPYFAYRHGLLRDFWWNLHVQFLPHRWADYSIDRRLLDDPWMRAVERHGAWVSIAFMVLLVPLIGVPAALVLGSLRIAGGILGHWFIGYWSHRDGRRPYRIPGASEHGTNNVLLGWISFGEGFHNNHHATPDSARIGRSRIEFDLGWYAILLLERLGLAWAVRSWCRGNAHHRGRRIQGGVP